MPRSRNYTVRLAGEDETVEHVVPEEIGDTILAYLTRGIELPAEAATPVDSYIDFLLTRKPVCKEVTDRPLRAFLDKHNGARRCPDRIITVGYFLKTYRGKEHFTREEVLKGLENAGEEAPANINRDLRWAMKNGWIVPVAGEEYTYFITQEGIRAIKANFPREIKKITPHP